MAIRVISFCDAGVLVPSRAELPALLTEGLKVLPFQLEMLDFNPTELSQAHWIWDWNPDVDREFPSWLAKPVVGLSWPNASGIGVHCSNYMTLAFTGVRWDIFKRDEKIRGAVIRMVGAIGSTLGAKRAWLVPDAGDAPASKALDMFFEAGSSAAIAPIVQSSPSCLSIEC